jgi:hypothetical protein
MFGAGEMGELLVSTTTGWQWADPDTGDCHKMTFWFCQALLPGEAPDLVRTFVQTELTTAIARGKSGDLHGWVRSGLQRGRYHRWKTDRAAAVDWQREHAAPLGQALPNCADQPSVWMD